MTQHEYNGITIRKCAGMNRNRSAATGYTIFTLETGRVWFKTLTEAKAYIDSMVAA